MINSLIINNYYKLIKIPEYKKEILVPLYHHSKYTIYNDVMCKLDRATLLHANHEEVKQTLEDKITSHIYASCVLTMYCNRSETIPCAKWFPALKLKFRVTLL
jgi:hypothetical protein